MKNNVISIILSTFAIRIMFKQNQPENESKKGEKLIENSKKKIEKVKTKSRCACASKRYYQKEILNRNSKC